MDSNRFDLLTRQLATGISRRQLLKAILSFTFGGLLANFGFRSTRNVYAESPFQASGLPLYLPHLARVCTEASTPSTREGNICGEFNNEICFCLGTTEGEIRCGKAPPCDIDHCTSSADCAHLGPGYFCDVPFSSNCGDPDQSRCIPPCEFNCPPDKVCGDKCCGEAQACSDGKCVSGYDCELSAITITTMRAALDELAAGATSVNLSPQGCIKIQQHVVDGQVLARSYDVADRPRYRWMREESQWIAESDDEADGFFEWRSVTTYGATAGDFETIEHNYWPDTREIRRRITTAPQGDAIHVVVEEDDGEGTLQIVQDYVTPAVQGATVGNILGADGFGEDGAAITAARPDADCEANPCDPAMVRQRLELGVERAADCMPMFGDRGIAMYMKSYDILAREMTIRCEAIDGPPQAAIGNWADPEATLVLLVDPAKYCNLDGDQREWILYHEVMHAAFRVGHDPAIEALPEEQRKQLDRVYGCMALCYNNKAAPTKCMCAQCFGTITCDPICAAFNSDCGATCPCPAAQDFYYNTCFECLAGCPSGLGCFGYSECDPVGHSPICEPKPTCP